MTTDKLLTVAELAEALNVSERAVRNRVTELPHYRFGRRIRFDLAAVLNSIEGAA